jgi:hypothetical protein
LFQPSTVWTSPLPTKPLPLASTLTLAIAAAGIASAAIVVRFNDGGSGMRNRDRPLEPGDELVDGGGRYRVVRVEAPPSAGSTAAARDRTRACVDPAACIVKVCAITD